MTLEEYLRHLPKGVKLVKIGSKQGISFFYCDKVSEKTFTELAKISQKYLSRMKAELKIKVGLMSHFEEYWEDRIAKIMKITDKSYQKKLLEEAGKGKDKEKAKERVAKKKKEIEKKLKELPKVLESNYKEKERMAISVPKRIKELEKDIPAFTSLLERQVVETYKGISQDEPNCLIIEIKGKEKGDYWSVIEYQDRDLPTLLKRRLGWQVKQ